MRHFGNERGALAARDFDLAQAVCWSAQRISDSSSRCIIRQMAQEQEAGTQRQ